MDHRVDTEDRDYNRLERYAQRCWETKDVEEKRKIVLDAVNKFEFRKNIDIFIKLAQTANAAKLDKLMADLVLIQSGDRVIK